MPSTASKVKWVSRLRFIGASGSGHGVIMDGSQSGDLDGSLGPSPMEMLLLGLGGCSAIDVVHILKRMRQPVEDCQVELSAERALMPPRVFKSILARYTVIGSGLAQERVIEAVRLSADKYCSASVMLGKAVEITREISVIDTSDAA
ncbi:MAG: OsmC family protein [Alphaproteobacteria bacterium]|nr:OsmC family protein [Alphaproteobacteria bacterium]